MKCYPNKMWPLSNWISFTNFHKKIYDNQFVTNANLDMFIVWGKEMPKHFSLISSIWKIIFMYVQTLTNHSFQMHLIRNMIIINNGNLKYFCNIYVYIFTIFYEAKKNWKWNWTTSIKMDWQSKAKKIKSQVKNIFTNLFDKCTL